MADLDQRTGKVIDNYASAVQSVEITFSTRLFERLMLREFGAGLVELLGRKMIPQLFAAYRVLLVIGIDIWEPRFRVRSIQVDGDVDGIRRGTASFSIEVDWRPRAHLGDFTVEGVRTFGLAFLDGVATASS